MIRPTPASAMSRGEWLREISPGDARRACGISAMTVAEALGVSRTAVCQWEKGNRVPAGPQGAAYLRFVQGLTRHLAVEAGDGPGVTDEGALLRKAHAQAQRLRAAGVPVPARVRALDREYRRRWDAARAERRRMTLLAVTEDETQAA